MTKPILTVLASLVLIAAGAGVTWSLRDHWADAPKLPPDADYLALQEHLGAPENVLRQELNALAATGTAPTSAADRERAHALTRECLDARSLLDISHVRDFVATTARGEVRPYHFLSEGDCDRLRSIVGEAPTAERVLAVKNGLADLAAAFAVIRQKPNWEVKIKGEAPPLVFMSLMVDASRSRPTEHHDLPGGAKVPAFSVEEAELLAHLDEFFNRPAALAAFPAKHFPNLYRDGRIPPIPALAGYKEKIQEGIVLEKEILLPGEQTTAEQLEEIDEIFGRLERFFEAIEAVQ